MQYLTLIADDAEMSYVFLKNKLGEEFSCELASDGLQALERCQKQVYDLIFTDVHMPIIDGLEFVTQLRQMNRYRYTPVVILTADKGTCEKQLVLSEQKNVHWMVKGEEPDQLADFAREFVESNRLT